MATSRRTHEQTIRDLLNWVRSGQHHGAIPSPPEWWFIAQAAQELERERYRAWLATVDLGLVKADDLADARRTVA